MGCERYHRCILGGRLRSKHNTPFYLILAGSLGFLSIPRDVILGGGAASYERGTPVGRGAEIHERGTPAQGLLAGQDTHLLRVLQSSFVQGPRALCLVDSVRREERFDAGAPRLSLKSRGLCPLIRKPPPRTLQ